VLTGVMAWVGAHVVVNVAAMVGLIPLTGITLPLLSYGGTSMMFVAFSLGLSMQMSRETVREVEEETGICLDPKNGRLIFRKTGDCFHDHVFLFTQEFDLAEVTLQESETCDKCVATREEILELDCAGKLVPYSYLDVILNS